MLSDCFADHFSSIDVAHLMKITSVIIPKGS